MPVNRRSFLLEGINKKDLGLEFGPSFNPAAPKREGYNIEIVDHLSKEDLIAHYGNHGVDLNAIEEVDYVWKGGSYADTTGKKGYYDYIIAGQVLEHATNFVAFLRDCSEMLKEEGMLSLSLPDKRLCFDTFRHITPLGKVLNDYYFPQSYHSAGSCVEYFLNTVYAGEQGLSWATYEMDASYRFTTDCETVRRIEKEVLEDHAFHDIHEYVFTPSSFELLVYDLNLLEYLDLMIEGPFKFYGHEFFAKLKKRKQPLQLDGEYRLRLLKKIQEELGEERVRAYKENQEQAADNQLGALSVENGRLSQQVVALEEEVGLRKGEAQRWEGEAARLNAELERRAGDCRHLEEENGRLEREKADILNSTCWRATRPLRAVMDKLRGR